MLFRRKAGDDIIADKINIALVGTNQIFHLPHIYKVFGNVLLFQLLRNLHDKMYDFRFMIYYPFIRRELIAC